MRFNNLTPHEIVISTSYGDIIIPPSGKVARVETSDVEIEPLCVGFYDKHSGCILPAPASGYEEPIMVPVINQAAGLTVVGLPEGELDCITIVSYRVKEACPGRKNLFAPDTGATAIRINGNNILAVTRLIAA